MDSYGVFEINEYLLSLPGIVFFGLWLGLIMLFWYNMDKPKTFRLSGFILSTSILAIIATIFGVWPITTW